jgi:hypothetical protein
MSTNLNIQLPSKEHFKLWEQLHRSQMNKIYDMYTEEELLSGGQADSYHAGKKLMRIEDGEVYTVDKCFLHWYGGWFFGMIALDSEGSSVVLTFANVNSVDEIIINDLQRFETEYKFI